MSTLIDSRPVRFIQDAKLEELTERYDFFPTTNRIRRAYYGTLSGQTGSATLTTTLTTPEDALILGIGMGARLDCSAASVPTNLSLGTDCTVALGSYTTAGWGTFGSDVDHYCVGHARIDQEALDIFDDLWEAPMVAGVGTSFQFDFAVSTQVATVWSLYQRMILEFLPIRRN